jgi:hypothetical protein
MEEDEFARISKLHQSSLEDVRDSHASATAMPTQYHRRNFVRAVFAMVEVSAFVFKLGVITFARQRGVALDKTDLDKLRVELWIHAGFPEAAMRERSLSLDDNVKYSLAAFARLQGHKYEFAKQPNYNLFTRSREIRNRITHPKSTNDFTISNDDFHCIDQFCEWYFSEAQKILRLRTNA